MDNQEFDIYSLKDNRNIKASGVSNKSFNKTDIIHRLQQTEKRTTQQTVSENQQVETGEERA